MTWLEDPPPWPCPGSALAPPCSLLCFASVIVWTESKKFTISDRWPLYLFYFDSETISVVLVAFVFWGWRLKNWSSTFLRKKLHPGDLARGCSDLEMTWLLCCIGATTVYYMPSPSCFGADLNPSSSSSHILILSSNCTFDTIAVLVVMFIT